eukprot:Skav201692  [mRNA]  locus=scaffold641:729755:730837:+ [translate_table: standard]
MDAWDGLLDEQTLIAQRKRRIAEQSKDDSDDEEDEERQRQEKAKRERRLAELEKKRQLDELYAKKLREQPTRPEHQAWLAQFDEKSQIEALALKRSQEQGRHSAALRAQRQALEEDSESEVVVEPGAMSDEEIWNDVAIEQEASLNVLKMVRDAEKNSEDIFYFHKQGKVIRDQLASGRLSPESCKLAFLKALDAQDSGERLSTFFLLHEMCYKLHQPGMIAVVVKVLEQLQHVVYPQQERNKIAKEFLEWGERNFFRHISEGEGGEVVASSELAQYQRVFLPNWVARMQQPREENIHGIMDLESDDDDGNHLVSALKSLAPEVPGEGDGPQQPPRPSMKPDLVTEEAEPRRSAKRQRGS